jgi:L-ascorbate metabolism protein UlaG (beta-lactamase superfamily)
VVFEKKGEERDFSGVFDGGFVYFSLLCNITNQISHIMKKIVALSIAMLAVSLSACSQVPQQAEVDTFETGNGKEVKFHALVHSSIRIEYGDMELYIDPVRQLGNRTIDYTSIPQADLIFVTHEHGDHYDKEAIKQLTRTGTRFITNSRCAEMMGYGLVMKNGEKQDLDSGILVEAVPAYNTTEGRTQFHPKGRDNGYILTLDGLRIYIAGDTEDIPEMAGIKDIDVAFLPCNQPYTMTTEQLVKAARMIKPKVLFPYHYGQTDVSTLPSTLKADGIDVRIRHYE